jgi:hypothetical protein
MKPEELPTFSKYSFLILMIVLSAVGLVVGFKAKIPTMEGRDFLMMLIIFDSVV